MQLRTAWVKSDDEISRTLCPVRLRRRLMAAASRAARRSTAAPLPSQPTHTGAIASRRWRPADAWCCCSCCRKGSWFSMECSRLRRGGGMCRAGLTPGGDRCAVLVSARRSFPSPGAPFPVWPVVHWDASGCQLAAELLVHLNQTQRGRPRDSSRQAGGRVGSKEALEVVGPEQYHRRRVGLLSCQEGVGRCRHAPGILQRAVWHDQADEFPGRRRRKRQRWRAGYGYRWGWRCQAGVERGAQVCLGLVIILATGNGDADLHRSSLDISNLVFGLCNPGRWSDQSR